MKLNFNLASTARITVKQMSVNGKFHGKFGGVRTLSAVFECVKSRDCAGGCPSKSWRYNRTSEFSKSFTFGSFLPLPGAIECPSSFNRRDCPFTPPGNFSFKLPSSLITRQ
jgi:hypothetical protein